jgi:hypothetical protein
MFINNCHSERFTGDKLMVHYHQFSDIKGREKYALLLQILQVPGDLMFQNLYHGPPPFIR